jgi:hypothetical protein
MSTTELCRMYWQDDNLYSGGRQHISQLKGTFLQARSSTGFSAILLCCELWQAVQVHKRYGEPLRLYRQGFDFTECTAFPYYTLDGPEIAVGLRDKIYCKPDNEACIAFWNICALVSFDAYVSQRRFYYITTWITRGGRGMLIGQV